MSLLNQLEINNEIDQALPSILAVKGHPVSYLEQSIREDYLKCICLVCYADKLFHENENNMLDDLSTSLGLSREILEKAKKFALNPSEEILKKNLKSIKTSNIALPCMMDMFILSYSDGQLCKRESQFISVFSKEWGVEGLTNNLKKLSNAVYNDQGKDAIRFFNQKLGVNHTERESLRCWLEAVLETTIEETKQEPEVAKPTPIPRKEGAIEKNCLQINSKLVTSLQREISSQFGKLQKLLGDMNAGSKSPAFEETSNQIEEEKQKVKDLRLTLAFVGTMKAGKSTTINAVVGANVLPNRSGAMTTMPTLVTHVPDCLEPVLHFRKNAPFTEAIGQIRKAAVADTLKQAQGALYEETLTRIANGELCRIETSYTGRQGIYDFMLAINDITRICEDLAVENPLKHYSAISDFPEIEVEFSYLSDRANDSQGRLTLIDTPGPNEAGQGHLKGVVKEQLAKASAIVCVVDPTQADSEAQVEIREWLQGAQKKSGAELFVLVNKVDTVKKTERRPDLFEAKALRLFPNFEDAAGNTKSITGKVFGVSSQQALLSNMVSRAIATKSHLPNDDEEPWVSDFLEKAYGTYWEDVDIKETGRHIEQGNRMWERSGMQAPMERLITASLQQVVPLCFGSALRMVTTQAETLKQESRVRWKALSHEVTVLEAHLERFKDSAEKLQLMEREAKEEYGMVLQKINQVLSSALDAVEKKNLNELESLVKNRREKQNEEKQNKEKQNSREPFREIFNFFRGRKRRSVEQVFDSNDPLVFDDVQEAQKFITDVMQPFHEMNRRTIDKKIIQIEKEVNDLSQNLGESVKKKLRPIISELNRELNKDFEVSLSIPNPSFPKIDLDLDIAAASLVRTEKQTKSYSERRWYTLWLCEHRVEYTVTEHKVDPRMLRETIKKTICSSVKQCSETLDAYISNSFQKNVSNYLCEIASILKRMNFALDEAIATRQENATTQIAQKSQFLALEEEFCTLVKRSTQAQNKLNTELGDMDDK